MNAKFQERYQKNIGPLTAAEDEMLRSKSICVVGCGGLGGYIIEGMARLGVGKITAIDYDCFAVSNLNRQRFANEQNLNRQKAAEAERQTAAINSEVRITPINAKLTADNADRLINGHDVIIDALDNIPGKCLLADACCRLGLPLVHGAISDWCGQVAVSLPPRNIISELYHNSIDVEEEQTAVHGNLVFIAATVANIQTAETVKLLVGKDCTLANKFLFLDMANHSYEIIDFGK